MGDDESSDEHRSRRLLLRNFLTIPECEELEFIHKSCGTVGYRENVFSTTLSHLIATNCHHLVVPFVSIRERLKDKVEEFFGCEYELFVEFTGLISWARGSSIGWHSDDNRPYLKQREFTAVCYLNTYGKDFKGGLLHFQNGEPTTVIPMAGDVIMYTADSRNIHSVDEVNKGERLTLTIWFSRDRAHDEDAKLISLLSDRWLNGSSNMPKLSLPIPASSSMYWFSPESATQQQLGFDICFARMHALGFDIYSSRPKSFFPSSSDILTEHLQVAKENELFEQEFVNILHALQAVQFYRWKASEFEDSLLHLGTDKIKRILESQREEIRALKSLFINDYQLAEAVFGPITCDENCVQAFNWSKFSAAISAFEDYTSRLQREFLMSLPYWRTEHIIYSVNSRDETGKP
ncbi:hypothetical protein K2173_015102 [Erythroxylum novogranatense]|uniref:procollagen-proline 3-dioxygenase n=1 Tax=Erythroxylum novogranatense TaxID=1862640 RepID=A0AAV8T0Z7_9ROSI|nr:hypothetical protein K2173_015102 [Erythroxylum novogranatense]